MIGNYRKWAEQLAEAGVDIKSNIKPVEFIFQQAKEKGVHLDFWQVCGAVWFCRRARNHRQKSVAKNLKMEVFSR